MSAPYGDIETKAEAAFAAAITAGVSAVQLDGASVVTAITAEDKPDANLVICECPNARGVKGVPGNYIATHKTRLETKINPPSNRAAALTTHRRRLAYIRDFITDSTFADSLSAATTEFVVQGIMSEWQAETRMEEDHFVSDLTQELYCHTVS